MQNAKQEHIDKGDLLPELQFVKDFEETYGKE